MSAGNLDFAAPAITVWRSAAQLSFQVRPFKEQLAAGFDERAGGPAQTDFCPIEPVAPAVGFIDQSGQIIGDGLNRRRLRLKTAKLRMPSVTARLAEKNFLGQQSLAPRGEQSFGVEVLRMNCPEPHRLQSKIFFRQRTLRILVLPVDR